MINKWRQSSRIGCTSAVLVPEQGDEDHDDDDVDDDEVDDKEEEEAEEEEEEEEEEESFLAPKFSKFYADLLLLLLISPQPLPLPLCHCYILLFTTSSQPFRYHFPSLFKSSNNSCAPPHTLILSHTNFPSLF